jgi:glutamate-5-semialdehyde dehydrogenase
MSQVLELAIQARAAASILACTSTVQRNDALVAMAQALRERSDEILAANRAAVDTARSKGTPEGLIDRLSLDEQRLEAIAVALEAVAALPDPIGEVVGGHTLPNGIELQQVRVPLGVVGMIYEARPNVTADAAGLCLKTGNAVILRGGSMAHQSNLALTKILAEAACGVGIPSGAIQAIETTDHEAAE